METKIEEKLIEKGLDAPRLTPDSINSVIKSVTYTTLPSGKAMICEIILNNGFSVRGESACVSASNFDIEIGQDISYSDARDKIWQLEGYLLQERCYIKEMNNV